MQHGAPYFSHTTHKFSSSLITIETVLKSKFATLGLFPISHSNCQYKVNNTIVQYKILSYVLVNLLQKGGCKEPKSFRISFTINSVEERVLP